MKRILLFLCVFSSVLFIPGLYEFTYRAKEYLFPSLSLIYLSSLRKTRLEIGIFHGLLFLFFILSSFSLINSYSVAKTVEGLFYASGLLLFSIALFNDERKEDAFRFFLLAAGTVIAGGYIQELLHITGIKPLPEDAYGTSMINFALGHRNPLSHFVSSSIPLFFLYMKTLSALASVILSCGILLLSGSRAGLFSGIFSICAVLLLTRRFKNFLLFIPAIFILLSPPFLKAVKKTLNPSYEPNRIRVLLWRDSLKILKEHPLTGAGLGAFPSALPFFWSDETAFTISSRYQDQFVENAHNDFVSAFAETGIAGGILFIVIITWSLLSLFLHRSPLSPYLLSSLLAILLIAIVDYPFRNHATSLLAVSTASFAERRKLFTLKIPEKTALISGIAAGIAGGVFLFSRVRITSLYMRFLHNPNPYSAQACIERAEKFIIDPLFYKGYYYMGNFHAVEGKLEDAERSYRKSLSLFKGNFPVMYNLAEVKIKKGEWKEAKKFLLELLKISPYYLKANDLMIKLLVSEGKKEEAEIYRERIKRLRERR